MIAFFQRPLNRILSNLEKKMCYKNILILNVYEETFNAKYSLKIF